MLRAEAGRETGSGAEMCSVCHEVMRLRVGAWWRLLGGWLMNGQWWVNSG